MILSFLSFAAGVFCYSIRELQAHGKLKWMQHGNYVRSFWDEDSYLRKYKLTDGSTVIPAPDNWYYRFFKIKYKERFPLSATLLVAFTDGYHLMQFLFKLLFCISIVTYSMDFNWWMALVYFVIWGITFTITYKLLSK